MLSGWRAARLFDVVVPRIVLFLVGFVVLVLVFGVVQVSGM